ELVPVADPFYIDWGSFQEELTKRGMTAVSVSDTGADLGELGTPNPHPGTARHPHFASLESFRPIVERAPEPQLAERQRREFFAQLQRWSRQGYAVHVF